MLILGRRRKSRKKIIKTMAKIPDVFECPRCAAKALVITIKKSRDENTASATVSCGSCGLVDDEDFIDIPVIYQPVDVYSKFIDLYSEGRARIKTGLANNAPS